MPIGSAYSHISRNKLSALVVRSLGALDLHTHLRLRPVFSFLRDYVKAGARYRVLEIGCGDGVIAFELAKLARHAKASFSYRGVDVDSKGLERARQLAHGLRLDDTLEFLEADAADVTPLQQGPWDIVILADILEHLETPENLLRSIRPLLGKGGICLVSVPTPRYERVFGGSFHRKVGHVRSGYRLDELNALFAKIGGHTICHKYSTGLLSSLGCAVFYRTPATPRLTAAKAILLSPWRLLDFGNGPRVSCSLFAAYRFEPRADCAARL